VCIVAFLFMFYFFVVRDCSVLLDFLNVPTATHVHQHSPLVVVALFNSQF